MSFRQTAAVAVAIAVAGGPASGAPTPVSRVTQDVIGHGFTSCAAALERNMKFLHPRDDDYAYNAMVDVKHADKSLAAALTIKPLGDGDVVTTTSASPNGYGGCDTTFTQTMVVEGKTCDVIRAETFKDWPEYQRVATAVVLRQPDYVGSKMVLSPTGAGGCLVVRTFVEFNAFIEPVPGASP